MSHSNEGLDSKKDLKKTAYILALEVMMADLNVVEESIRFLELLGETLQLNNLEISSIKHTMKFKYQDI